jgi:thymidylate synthase (FAD)
MSHVIIPEAEELLDKEIKVLDKGFVRLVDYLGGDQRIVQSARVSYGSGTKTTREDKDLINYLMRNAHTSPFEQVILTFHCKMPVFVARQWVRHRTARLNEISGRYSVMKDEFYIPEENQIRIQSESNKQGRGDLLDKEKASEIINSMSKSQSETYKTYKEYLDMGAARELARINLPLSLYTEWYWQIDLHNLFHFIKLRLDNHAQYEIRVYAEVLAQCAKAVAPMAYEAFEENVFYGSRFSRSEIENIKNIISGKEISLKGRIRREFFEKLGIKDEKI